MYKKRASSRESWFTAGCPEALLNYSKFVFFWASFILMRLLQLCLLYLSISEIFRRMPSATSGLFME